MPLLQVRDFPDDIYEVIKFKAKQEHRTIAQQTIVLIKNGLGDEASNRERLNLALERTKKMEVPEEAKKIDHVKWIREDRNR